VSAGGVWSSSRTHRTRGDTWRIATTHTPVSAVTRSLIVPQYQHTKVEDPELSQSHSKPMALGPLLSPTTDRTVGFICRFSTRQLLTRTSTQQQPEAPQLRQIIRSTASAKTQQKIPHTLTFLYCLFSGRCLVTDVFVIMFIRELGSHGSDYGRQ
jgi:hypothetical protein